MLVTIRSILNNKSIIIIWGEHEREPLSTWCEWPAKNRPLSCVKCFQMRRPFYLSAFKYDAHYQLSSFPTDLQCSSSLPPANHCDLSKSISACTDAVKWRPCHSDASSQPLMSIKVDQCMQSISAVIVMPPVNH